MIAVSRANRVHGEQTRRMTAMDGELEQLRAAYRPAHGELKLLLLGESPPPGSGFFYLARSTIFTCTRRVLVEQCDLPHDANAFLDAFAGAGFFLDDFSSARGDQPAGRPDDPDVRASVARIAQTIGSEQPLVVVGVLQRIERLVGEAVDQSQHPETPWICLPFPNWRSDSTRKAYEAALRHVIEDFDLAATTPLGHRSESSPRRPTRHRIS
jgi:hypothetical protein